MGAAAEGATAVPTAGSIGLFPGGSCGGGASTAGGASRGEGGAGTAGGAAAAGEGDLPLSLSLSEKNSLEKNDISNQLFFRLIVLFLTHPRERNIENLLDHRDMSSQRNGFAFILFSV